MRRKFSPTGFTLVSWHWLVIVLGFEVTFFDVKNIRWVIMLFAFKVWTEKSHTSLSFILNRLVGISERNLNIYLIVMVLFFILVG
jgi:hypothetical protein